MQISTAPLPVLVMAGHSSGPPRTRLMRGDRLPGNKALLQVDNRPLIAYTLDALRGSPRVGSITLAGLLQSELAASGYTTRSWQHFLPNQPSLVENGLAGLRAILAREPNTEHVLVLAGDAPLLSAEAVTWFVDACAARTADLYMAIVARTVMEARFPGSGRTYLRTRAGAYCSGDLFLVRPQTMLAHEPMLRRLLAQRKRPMALLRTVGLRWVLRALLGRIHPDDLRTAAGQLAGVEMRAVILPFAGAAMDVDKPFQLEIVRAALRSMPTA